MGHVARQKDALNAQICPSLREIGQIDSPVLLMLIDMGFVDKHRHHYGCPGSLYENARHVHRQFLSSAEGKEEGDDCSQLGSPPALEKKE